MNTIISHCFITCFAVLLHPFYAHSQNADSLALATTAKKMKSGLSVNQALSDASLMKLHSLTPFRELIKKHARTGTLIPVAADEPGKRITVSGVLMDKAGNIVPDALIYVYQTDARGYYADTGIHIRMNEGDRRHARLFGYLLTNAQGRFTIETINPSGYPGSVLPAHIHFEVTYGSKTSTITELRFDDDPRLTPAQRTQSQQEQFYISKNSGTAEKPVYEYNISFR